MSKRTKTERLHTLIPLEEFKALMGIDSREDKTARFCLLTATLTIEQYCMRKFLRKKYIEIAKINNNLIIPFREYPVTEIVEVRSEKRENRKCENVLINEIFYRPMIGNYYNCEMPFELLLSQSLKPYRYNKIKIIYWAGYKAEDIPADLAAACLELASWNMNRYRGRQIGVIGNNKKDSFEMSMPENVCKLLEPYRRKTI